MSARPSSIPRGVIRHNHHAPLNGDIFFFAANDAVAEIEILQHLVDEFESFEVLTLREQRVEFPLTQQLLEKSHGRAGDEIGLGQKRGVSGFQQLLDIDHAHGAGLRLAMGPLHDEVHMCQLRCGDRLILHFGQAHDLRS